MTSTDLFKHFVFSTTIIYIARLSCYLILNLVIYQYRQYFENSTRETAFIGFSTETTALAVRQATEDIAMERDEDGEGYLDKVIFSNQSFHMQEVYVTCDLNISVVN